MTVFFAAFFATVVAIRLGVGSFGEESVTDFAADLVDFPADFAARAAVFPARGGVAGFGFPPRPVAGLARRAALLRAGVAELAMAVNQLKTLAICSAFSRAVRTSAVPFFTSSASLPNCLPALPISWVTALRSIFVVLIGIPSTFFCCLSAVRPSRTPPAIPTAPVTAGATMRVMAERPPFSPEDPPLREALLFRAWLVVASALWPLPDAPFPELRRDEERGDELRLPELRALVLRPLELRPLELRPLELRALELRPLEPPPLELRALELRPLELPPLALRLELLRLDAALRPLELRPLALRPLVLRPLDSLFDPLPDALAR